MLKIKWTDRITNEEVFQRVKEKRIILKMLNKRQCHSLRGHIIRYSEFVVNILEAAVSGKKIHGKTSTTILRKVARNIRADRYKTMKRTACNKSKWKAANQSKD
jgi:hypothetical protein